VVANEAGRQPPLVFCHVWPKDESDLTERLGKLLGPDQPLYGILPPPIEVVPSMRRIEPWVDWYLDRLTALPLQAPYRLLGWSGGGVLALELGRRLTDQGVAVEFVGMIDSWFWPTAKPLRVAAYHLNRYLAMEAATRSGYVLDAFRHSRRRIKRRARDRGAWVMLRLASAVGARQRSHKVEIETSWAGIIRHYAPTPVQFPVAYFRTEQTLTRQRIDPLANWAGMFFGGFTAVLLPGGHWSIWSDDNIKSVAASLLAALPAGPPSADNFLVNGQPAQGPTT
jgi:thioesterase domain-containing protein